MAVNYSHRKVPQRRKVPIRHRRARSDMANDRNMNGAGSPSSRRSSYSQRTEFENVFDRFQRDKDRELINLLLERLRETQVTIQEKQEECGELTRDLTEQRERR